MIQSDQQKKTFNNHQTKLIPRKIFPKYNLIAFLNSCNPWRYHNLETWPFSMTLTMDLNILHQVKTIRGLPPSERCLGLRTLGETRSLRRGNLARDLKWPKKDVREAANYVILSQRQARVFRILNMLLTFHTNMQHIHSTIILTISQSLQSSFNRFFDYFIISWINATQRLRRLDDHLSLNSAKRLHRKLCYWWLDDYY